jgi:hypothetical protein
LLVQETLHAAGEQQRAMEERLGGPILAVFERGAETGEFARALPPAWTAAAFGALCVSALHEVAVGHLGQAEAGELVTATLLHGLLGQCA